MKLRAAIAACLFVLVLPAEAGSQPVECEDKNLRLVLHLDQQEYTMKQPVKMKMVIINQGPRCTMVWSDGQSHDFYVFDGKDQIWADGACRGYTQAVVTETWEREHREVYRSSWRRYKNQEGGDCEPGGPRAGAGNYQLQGHFLGDGEPRTRKLDFRITEG